MLTLCAEAHLLSAGSLCPHGLQTLPHPLRAERKAARWGPWEGEERKLALQAAFWGGMALPWRGFFFESAL